MLPIAALGGVGKNIREKSLTNEHFSNTRDFIFALVNPKQQYSIYTNS
jgi:hypothetical protein